MDASEQVELGTAVAERKPLNGEDVTPLLRLAMEKDLSVDVLERLVALREREAERNARDAFFGALAEFQAECPTIVKGHKATVTTDKGGRFSYTYADLGDIVETIRPLLHRHKLSYTWDSEVTEDNRLRVTCRLRHAWGHEGTASFTAPIEAKTSAMNKQQEVGAALTYGRRQSLVQALGITTADEDTDGRAPASAAKLSEGQAADLRAKLEEVGGDESKFLQHFRAADWAHFPADRMDEALALLEQKRRAAK